MKKLISCEFNIDTACVELKYSDGSMVSIIPSPWKMRLSKICMNNLSWTI